MLPKTLFWKRANTALSRTEIVCGHLNAIKKRWPFLKWGWLVSIFATELHHCWCFVCQYKAYTHTSCSDTLKSSKWIYKSSRDFIEQETGWEGCYLKMKKLQKWYVIYKKNRRISQIQELFCSIYIYKLSMWYIVISYNWIIVVGLRGVCICAVEVVIHSTAKSQGLGFTGMVEIIETWK